MSQRNLCSTEDRRLGREDRCARKFLHQEARWLPQLVSSFVRIKHFPRLSRSNVSFNPFFYRVGTRKLFNMLFFFISNFICKYKLAVWRQLACMNSVWNNVEVQKVNQVINILKEGKFSFPDGLTGDSYKLHSTLQRASASTVIVKSLSTFPLYSPIFKVYNLAIKLCSKMALGFLAEFST